MQFHCGLHPRVSTQLKQYKILKKKKPVGRDCYVCLARWSLPFCSIVIFSLSNLLNRDNRHGRQSGSRLRIESCNETVSLFAYISKQWRLQRTWQRARAQTREHISTSLWEGSRLTGDPGVLMKHWVCDTWKLFLIISKPTTGWGWGL